jgi:diaminopimelate epimerase
MFYKAHGLGNDFIIFFDKVTLSEDDIVKLCRPHFGIGADGIVIVTPDKNNEYHMSIYNSDGSEARTCGNALRCVGKLINKLKGEEKIIINTKSDQNIVEIKNDKITTYFRLPTFLNPCLITLNDQQFNLLEIGNLHAVTKCNDVNSFNFTNYAQILQRNYPYNLEAFEITNPDMVNVRFYEYGCGETLCCSSGSVALFYFLYSKKLVSTSCTIKCKGGNLKLTLDNNKINVEGDAKIIFKGELIDGEL